MEGLLLNKLKRNERIGVMVKILTENPGHLFPLTYFSELFDAAKSTISEDIVISKGIFQQFDLGELETVAGAAGGVKYLPIPSREKAAAFVREIIRQLSDPERILPGGFLYMADILSNPAYVEQMGQILASQFYKNRPDFVITVETKGIPVAFMTARALNRPLVIARRDNKITEGSVVTINYLSGSTRRIQTMSLAKRALKAGQKVLIIDDFMKGGGTAKGIMDLMKEFSVTVVGVGVIMSTREPEKKLVDQYKSLMMLNMVDEYKNKVEIECAPWLLNL